MEKQADGTASPEEERMVPIPAWWGVVHAAKWLGVTPPEFLAMDQYDQACVQTAIAIETEVANKRHDEVSARRRRKG